MTQQIIYSEEKLYNTVKWFIKFLQAIVDSQDDYCQNHCPVRDQYGCCPAEIWDEYEVNGDWEEIVERDCQDCMELQIDFFVEKANEKI